MAWVKNANGVSIGGNKRRLLNETVFDTIDAPQKAY